MTQTAIAASRRGLAANIRWRAGPRPARVLVLVVIAAAATAGILLTSADASERAVALSGAELVRLLRFMALLKATMAAATVAAVLWRLGIPTSGPRLAAYAVAGGAMAAGPGLIWGMVHVGLGALLLHGGLLAGLVLLWRDPAVAMRLSGLLAARAAARRQDVSGAWAPGRPAPPPYRSRPRD